MTNYGEGREGGSPRPTTAKVPAASAPECRQRPPLRLLVLALLLLLLLRAHAAALFRRGAGEVGGARARQIGSKWEKSAGDSI